MKTVARRICRRVIVNKRQLPDEVARTDCLASARSRGIFCARRAAESLALKRPPPQVDSSIETGKTTRMNGT